MKYFPKTGLRMNEAYLNFHKLYHFISKIPGPERLECPIMGTPGVPNQKGTYQAPGQSEEPVTCK